MSTMLTIDDAVPAPAVKKRQTYPFYDMRVGDSFLITDESYVRNARSAAWMFGKRHRGVRFSCRRVDGGWRLWRIA
jgi:hypothetical protein